MSKGDYACLFCILIALHANELNFVRINNLMQSLTRFTRVLSGHYFEDKPYEYSVRYVITHIVLIVIVCLYGI